MLCQRGLAAAVVAEDGGEAPLRDVQLKAVKNDVLLLLVLPLIAVDQLVHANCLFFHTYFLCFLYLQIME